MGAAIAKLFAAEGAKVVVNGRNKDRGEQVVHDIIEHKGQAKFVQSDISTEEGNTLLLNETLKTYGGLDIAVANAGFLGLGSITEVSIDTWHQTINTNLNSIFYLTRLTHFPIQNCLNRLSSIRSLSTLPTTLPIDSLVTADRPTGDNMSSPVVCNR